MIKKIFISKTSPQDAAFKAKLAGYVVVGYGTRPNGVYVVFARK